ncbi:Gfo/Idh/MocA family oxidoreductase [Fulvivirga sp. M361]|uniref:Gfo/Idh/MocA family protein n=1 Tax=Fulvivirga sp. M361 TaxID=2594266 RepID=UPI00117B9D37|nr:Gfo/Idh/MocA family oxidoreductase [Fulvivirga sp. M361]TRX56302.1 Gfo/Idh/MocA family oxidoreductase [Fulvivirga sp. M361]
MKTNSNRREFIKKTSAGTIGLAMSMSAKSYSNILGANDRLRFGVAGLHGRGKALIKAAAALPNATVSAICDVDSRQFDFAGELVHKVTGKKAKHYKDYRKMAESKHIDCIAIATPEHWHAPMAIMGAQNGKHVYVEKPCSHNPQEGIMLIEAQKKYDVKIQMGNQQRSAPTSIQAMQDIKEGLIGEPYYGKAWYSNGRRGIGRGQVSAVPDWLDWELWQGPAPRAEYKSIYVHYNWHWFWQYGTGEIHNNGTHEIDVCRWALGVKYPDSVTSSGGRFHYKDDWEFYDTQVVNYEYGNGKMITWEGRSCNPFHHYGRGRGATIHGTKGTILLDRNNYVAYDMGGKEIKNVKEAELSATTNTIGEGNLDKLHFKNFADAIREGIPQNSPIDEGACTSHLCHLGNISQRIGRKLHIDKETGKMLNDTEAMSYWSREYAPGWEPVV